MNYEAWAREIKEILHLEKVLVAPIALSATSIIPKSLTTSFDFLELSHSLIQTMQEYTILHSAPCCREFTTDSSVSLPPVTITRNLYLLST